MHWLLELRGILYGLHSILSFHDLRTAVMDCFVRIVVRFHKNRKSDSGYIQKSTFTPHLLHILGVYVDTNRQEQRLFIRHFTGDHNEKNCVYSDSTPYLYYALTSCRICRPARPLPWRHMDWPLLGSISVLSLSLL